MKQTISQCITALLLAVGMGFGALGAEIQCVADGSEGEYCGFGYGINVQVSTPSSGYMIQYAESATGPWQSSLTYADVCTDRAIYYKVSAAGYTDKIGSATVTVTPKELTADYVWGVYPAGGYVYDGAAKTPEAAFGDGEPSIIAESDFTVSYEDNVNAGSAKIVFTGKGNYTGTVEEEFEIAKAENAWTTEPSLADWTYGETASEPVSAAQVGNATVTYSSGEKPTLPGSYTATFTVPESANYRELKRVVPFQVKEATVSYVADGTTGEYCGAGYGISVNVSKPSSGAMVKYSETGTDGTWVDSVKYVNVCTEKPIFFQIAATGHTTVTGSANVTITPKELTTDYVWGVYPAGGYVYDGAAKTPEAAFGDGEPSIIAASDFTVSYEDNVNAGTAKIVFTGKGNYTGTVEEEFEIAKAENAWTTEPSLADWTYGETASEPVSAAQVGTAAVTYSSGEKPTLPGSYTATFTVPESANYRELKRVVPFQVKEATVSYVADGTTGEYCGAGYGISVNVSKPSSGATVKYSETGADGTWVDSVKYVDVCTDRPIFFQIAATGHTTVTGSAKVTVTPKELTADYVWDVYPAGGYVYDGTAKTPEAAFGDGEPSIITESDFTVSYEDNVNAGTAKIVFTGRGNYTGTVEEEFEIAKAENAWTTEPSLADWTYGETASEPVSAAQVGTAAVTYSSGEKPTLPGSYTATFTVPESANYRELKRVVPFQVKEATVSYVADGTTGEYCGAGYGISVNVSKPSSGATVKYSETGADGTWVDSVKYVDVCTEKPIFFQIAATGHTTVTGSAKVTVTPKELTADYVWGVYPAGGYVYDGAAKTPEAAFGDGEPSIIAASDFTVSYEDNVEAGTAKIVFTGRGNYTGTVEEEFEIAKAQNAWTTEPSIADWTYGETASEPVSAARVGTAAVTYSSGEKPTLPGSYTATFTVPESANYRELKRVVPFQVKEATVSYVADGTTGEYCGAGYGISVNVSKPTSGATVKYSETGADGTWVDSVKYIDVCTDRPIFFQISATGHATVTGSAKVTVTPKELTADYVWGVYPAGGYVYDGTAKTPEAACGDGEPSIIAASDFTVSYEDNVNAGTAKIVFTGKGNYTGTVEEEFEIRKANGWGGGDEPGGGEVPPGGLSKYDVTAMYNGQFHTIDTNALEMVTQTGFSLSFEYAFAENGPFAAQPILFKDVTVTSIWYKICFNNSNYEDYIHQAKVTITNLPVTITSQDKSKPWDGTPLKLVTEDISLMSSLPGSHALPHGESFVYGDFAERTDVGSTPATYSVIAGPDTLLSNYEIHCVTGILTVTTAPIPPGPTGAIVATGYTNAYDGAVHGVSVMATGLKTTATVQYKGSAKSSWQNASPTYSDVCDTQIWWKVSAPNYQTVEGTIGVKITQAENEWMTTPAIEGWTYGETAKTPVGAAKFGTVAFTYDPTPVGDAGDYTMTASVSGTANYTALSKDVAFTITSSTPKYALLTGSIAWKLNLGSGCYTAQLKLTCTNGFESGISNLRYLFADRVNGSKTTASLWDSSSRAVRPTTSWRDVMYRSVELDASKITRQGASVVYGVKDVSQAKGVISSDECTIELYVPSLAVPSSYEGLVVWTSGGSDHALKISALGGATPVPEPVSAAALAQPILTTVTPVTIPTATTDELGLRNVFTSKDKTDKAIADAVLSIWKGTYVMAYPEIDEDCVTNGWNTFNIKIGTRGRTTISGILANGKSVSTSAQMLVGDEWCKIAVSSTRKNATFAFTLWPSRDGEVLEVEGVEGAVINEVGNLSGESTFRLSVDDLARVLGPDAEIMLDDVLPEDVSITLNGRRWVLPRAGAVRVAKKQLDYSRVRENPSALRLSYSRSKGRFAGSFKVYLWDGKKLKCVSATVKGIVVDGAGYGTAKVGKYGTMPILIEPVEAE